MRVSLENRSKMIAQANKLATSLCEAEGIELTVVGPEAPLVAGIVLSGGPSSVMDAGAPDVAEDLFMAGKPLLGICYGMQLMCHKLGGQLAPAHNREYGHAEIEIVAPGLLFEGLPTRQPVWMSHGDHVEQLPPGFEVQARTDIADLWQPDTAALHGLNDVWGVANPLLLSHWSALWEATGGRGTRLYDMLNAKYVLARPETATDSDFQGIEGVIAHEYFHN